MKAFAKIKKSDYVAILKAMIDSNKKELEDKIRKEVYNVYFSLVEKTRFFSAKPKYNYDVLGTLAHSDHDIMDSFYNHQIVSFANSVKELDEPKTLRIVLSIQVLQETIKKLEKTFDGLTFVKDDHLYVSVDDLPSHNEALKLGIPEILKVKSDESKS